MDLDTVLVIVVLLGATAGAFSFFRNPDSYISLGKSLLKELYPILAKRMSPEEEAQWRAAIKKGEEWDHLNKKPKTRNK